MKPVDSVPVPTSPLPWGVSGIWVFDDTATPVCKGAYGSEMPTFPQAKSNAELIVRAVNSHAGLLDALKALAAEASGFKSMATVGDHGITNVRVLQHWIDNARAVIAKAEAK